MCLVGDLVCYSNSSFFLTYPHQKYSLRFKAYMVIKLRQPTYETMLTNSWKYFVGTYTMSSTQISNIATLYGHGCDVSPSVDRNSLLFEYISDYVRSYLLFFCFFFSGQKKHWGKDSPTYRCPFQAQVLQSLIWLSIFDYNYLIFLWYIWI